MPSSRAGAPKSRFARPTLPSNVEATASAEDPTLRLATFTPLSDDESHAPSPVSGAVVSCPLCDGEEEDCFHLFFTCPMVHEAWRAAGVAHLVAFSNKAFWSSLVDSSFRREMDWRRAFATLWVIWLYKNEVIFRDVLLSGDAIQHAAGGFFFVWNRGGSGPSYLVPL